MSYKKKHKNEQNLQKKHKKWPGVTHFLIFLTIATKRKHLEAYNLAIFMDKAFSTTVYSDEKFLSSVSDMF